MHAIQWALIPIEDRVMVKRPFCGVEQARRYRQHDGTPLEQIVSEERADELRRTFPGCGRRAGRYVGVTLETGFAMVHESEVVGEGVVDVPDDLPERRKMETPDGAVLVKPKKVRAKRAPQETASLSTPDDYAIGYGDPNDCGASSRVNAMPLRLDSTPHDEPQPFYEAYERVQPVPVHHACRCAVEPTARDPRLPVAGTPIRREFHGAIVEVIEQPDGQFACGIVGDDNSVGLYSSLSRAASAVAGSSQNGFVWFKLGKKE
jgi:hypothetical protein